MQMDQSIHMLQAHARRQVRHMQLELSIRPNVSNTSSGCPFSSLRVLPAAFVSPSSCNRLFHYSSTNSLPHPLCSLGTSVVQRQYASPHSQVIQCVLYRQLKTFSAIGLCVWLNVYECSPRLFSPATFSSLYSITLTACFSLLAAKHECGQELYVQTQPWILEATNNNG